jgi:hypothetical protein
MSSEGEQMGRLGDWVVGFSKIFHCFDLDQGKRFKSELFFN